MKRMQSSAQDFLGIIAFVGAVGGLMRAAERRKLDTLFKALVARYEMLYRDYQAFLQLNHSLQEEVVRLRAENNRLMKRVAP